MVDNEDGLAGEHRQPASPLWRLRLTRKRLEGLVLLEVNGRIGRTAAGTLLTELEAIISEGDRHVIADLQHVDYVSSAGLLALETARDRMTALHGHLALCSLTAAVRIAFELAGLTGQFLIESSREEAVRRMNGEVAR